MRSAARRSARRNAYKEMSLQTIFSCSLCEKRAAKLIEIADSDA